MTTAPSWQLEGTKQDQQSITADWMPLRAAAIHDVVILESRWVNKANGRLTELYRRDWLGTDAHVDQVFHVVLTPGGVSAWHVHGETVDRLFVASGQVRVVLYDARSDSPTYRQLLELLLSEYRPQLVIVPAGVWHGVENVGTDPAVIVNMPDRAYHYEAPDHWRLPPSSDQIPYTFGPTPASRRVSG